VLAVEETLAAYRQAWLDDDRASVLDFLSDEVVLFQPGRTAGRIVGKEAVREFWFPESSVSYPVRGYEISGQEIFGSGMFAAAVGRSELTWETVENGEVTDRTVSRSDFVTILRNEQGGWKIHRQMYQMRD
jgi:ketosteroid isomerase-like protein